MRKRTVFFHPIEGSGSLTISWTSGPKGNAVEAKKGSGVGFFLILERCFVSFLMKSKHLKINRLLSSIIIA
jgi:hypothetical protein